MLGCNWQGQVFGQVELTKNTFENFHRRISIYVYSSNDIARVYDGRKLSMAVEVLCQRNRVRNAKCI